MKEKTQYLLVIGGNGRIGRNFILHALKNTNYKIINLDPSEDFSKNNKSINKERYIHLKICLGLESSFDELLNFFKGFKSLFNVNGIINLSRVNIHSQSDLDIEEEDLVNSANAQIIVMMKIIKYLLKVGSLNECSIVHAGSLSSRLVNHQSILYHYLKGAIESASKAMAFKLAKNNVRSNVVVCGLVNDPDFELNCKQINTQNICVPLASGPPTLIDVSNLILFLISPLSKSITGTSIIIDAGMSLPDTYTIVSSIK